MDIGIRKFKVSNINKLITILPMGGIGWLGTNIFHHIS